MVIVLLVLFTAASFFSGTHSAVFTIHNNCPFTIWPATLTGSGAPVTPGFELRSHVSSTINVAAPWSGRVWARFACSNQGESLTCRSGETAPATLVEFTLAPGGGKDFYDVSLVDGFNLPVSVVPQGGYDCGVTNCPVDISAQCPGELAVRNTDGSTIGCKSACLAFGSPQYCCTGQYSTPQTCSPTNYSLFFKNRCPKAYSYAYDDATSTFTCSGGANYLITFCP